MKRDGSGQIVVSIFCGGRGGSTLIREFLRRPEIELNALINAYDDGLSTGQLRGLIPGMLGPSDFRKNLASFLHFHSSGQYALTQLLELRIKKGNQDSEVACLQAWAVGSKKPSKSAVSKELLRLLHELDFTSPRVRGYLATFFEYQSIHDGGFDFADCSIGNLIFAGAFLENKRSFNAATAAVGRDFHSRIRLLNVTTGENRILVALKTDGTVLKCEEQIVARQNNSKITDLFFLGNSFSDRDIELLDSLQDIASKKRELEALHHPVTISTEAQSALRNSDIIIYGPGTQFSSLMPSYMTTGINEAIFSSRARIKVFIPNIHRDHDIQACTATDIISKALELLRDPENQRKSITHVLYTDRSSQSEELLPLGYANVSEGFENMRWVSGNFENPTKSGIHSGYVTVNKILDIYKSTLVPSESALDIYVNLYKRSLAVNQLIDEFLELPWQAHFKKVRLLFNHVVLPPLELPDYLEIKSVNHDEMFSEANELVDWAGLRSSRYLATISGDGEYRLCDIFKGMEVLTQHSFSAVYGSRNQSQKQFYHSLDAAYGESPLLYLFSLLGGFLFSLLFTIRFGVVLSDPVTGFRIYDRTSLAPVLKKIAKVEGHSTTGTTRLLLQNGCEIAEIPVSYRTFKGFTNTRWRLLRAFHNAWHIFF